MRVTVEWLTGEVRTYEQARVYERGGWLEVYPDDQDPGRVASVPMAYLSPAGVRIVEQT